MENSEEKIFIHAGTQNGAILGLRGDLDALHNCYAYAPNLGSVKCVTTSGRYLITGGFDEIIRLYDLKKLKEKGQLIGHEGTITCIKSYKNFIISGAEDHNIIIWKVREWSLLHRLKGHKDAVYDLSLHSSGKILASVGKDKKIILWNLINGTKLFRKTMNFNMYKVEWTPEDNNLIVMSDNSIHIISQESNTSIKEVKHPRRINDFIIINGCLIVGGDDGFLYFWNDFLNVDQESHNISFKAHTPRVKRIKHLVYKEKNYLVTCSTDGPISIWDIEDILSNIEFVSENKVIEESPKPVYTINAYQRIIALDAHLESQIYQNDPKPKNATDEKGEIIPEENGKNNDQEELEKEENNDQKLDKKSKKIKKVTFNEPEKETKPKKIERKDTPHSLNLNESKKQPKNKSKKNQKKNKSKLVVEYDDE